MSLVRTVQFSRHCLRAHHTHGFGIHSPSLFYLVSMVIEDKNRYYVWENIEKERARVVQALSHGSGQFANECASAVRPKTLLRSRRTSQVAFRLVNYLQHRLKRDLNLLEIGDSLGITTAYLAAVSSLNTVFTISSDKAMSQGVETVWNSLGLQNITQVTGCFRDILPTFLDEHPAFDMIVVNNSVSADDVALIWHLCGANIHEKSLFLLDGIHDYEAVWEQIKADKQVTSTLDYFHFGVVCFDTNYMRMHYKLMLI